MSFERDIRPLFRRKDVEAMAFAFDLSSYEDVQMYAHDIYDRLADGSMPCDGAWREERLQLFRHWLDTDMPK